LASKVDDSSQTIGKRYARTDEIGIPFGITVDHDTLTDNTVTLRERDSASQIRIKIDEVANLVSRLSNGKTTWHEVLQKYPLYISKSDQEEQE